MEVHARASADPDHEPGRTVQGGRGRRRGRGRVLHLHEGPRADQDRAGAEKPSLQHVRERAHEPRHIPASVQSALPTAAFTAARSPIVPVFVVWHRWSELRLDDNEPLVRASEAARKERGKILHLYPLELETLVGRSRVAGVRRCSVRRARFWAQVCVCVRVCVCVCVWVWVCARTSLLFSR